MLWNAVRFFGHTKKELDNKTNEVLGGMSDKVFAEETGLAKIVRENKEAQKEKK